MSDDDRAPLQRELGLTSAVLLVVGCTIGSGIYFTPAEVARALPGPWSILLVWIVGAAVALAGAFTYAELGAMMPCTGGHYVYIREAFGRLPAFLCGWLSLTMVAGGALAAVSLGFATYVGQLVPIGDERILAIATIAVVTGINYLGLKPGLVFQNALATIKIAALLFLILWGLMSWQRFSGMHSFEISGETSSARALATAFIPVLFTLGGWQQMTAMSGEIRNPGRFIPLALTLGLGLVIACYLGVNAVFLHVLGRGGVASSEAVAADTARQLIGDAGGTVVGLAAAVSLFGLAHVVMFSMPRLFFAVAQDHSFVSAAARIHPCFGSPHIAIGIIGGWSIALLLLTGGQITALLGGVVFADWMFVGLGAASVFVLRRRLPLATRPYRVVGYPILPMLFVFAAVVAVTSAVIAAPKSSLVSVALLAVGAAIYVVKSRGHAHGA